MTSHTIRRTTEPGLWRKIWHWLRAVEEAMDHDPTDALHRRINILETRLRDLEATR
jgi:hypothetical protein